MKTGSKALRILEGGLLVLSLLLLAMFAFAHIHRFIMFRTEMAKFETRQLESTKESAAGKAAIDGAIHDDGPHQAPNSEYSTSSIQRTKSYQANLGKPIESLAILRIPTLHLEVPLLEGTDAVTLNRGVGRIAGTSLPGQEGNIGIAGHRDGFFRKLKDIRIRITSPADVSALRPRAKHSLTLVTCYPFYFVGPAPSRYIVDASLKGQAAQHVEQQERSLLIEGEKQ
jgi:sortase A